MNRRNFLASAAAGAAAEGSVFLTNLDNDPGESINLRRRHPDIVDRLLTEIQKWSREQ